MVVLMKGFDMQQNCNNCYNCKHRQDVPGSAHSSCRVFKRNSDVHTVIAPSIVKLVLEGGQSNFITLNPHGVVNGWCSWPIDFDPCWVSDCKLWESKDEN